MNQILQSIFTWVIGVAIGGVSGMVFHELFCPTCRESRRKGYTRSFEIFRRPMTDSELLENIQRCEEKYATDAH